MSIEVWESSQITRRRFFDLATKAVAAMMIVGATGKILAEEATEVLTQTYRVTMNIATRFSAEHGWEIGTSYVHPESGSRVHTFDESVDKEQL